MRKFRGSRFGWPRHIAAASLLAVAGSCHAAPVSAPQPESPGEWKTAFYKRGFVGVYQAGWAEGVNSTIRLRVPIPMDGTKVRVTLGKMRDGETVLSKMSLVRANTAEAIAEGKTRPILFGGQPGVSIPANAPDVVSDAADGSLARGNWYLQQSYASEKYLYAYHNDGFYNEAGDRHDAAKLEKFKAGTWPGNVQRIEVFTTDTRPIILCYGDSITHGYGSSANGGNAYPEVLGALTKLPTLNLGVNGDVITYSGGAPGLVNSFNGVGSVIVLMGINDIIGGMVKSVDQYSKLAGNLVSSFKRNGKKTYIGTITPASGYAAFDKDPEKEKLRQEINAWIRKDSGADGVIDFDAALADPANPARLKAEYQMDWLHPSDAGYRRMAEEAARLFPSPPTPVAAPSPAKPLAPTAVAKPPAKANNSRP